MALLAHRQGGSLHLALGLEPLNMQVRVQADRRVLATLLLQLQEMRLHVSYIPNLPRRLTVGLNGLQVQVRLTEAIS